MMNVVKYKINHDLSSDVLESLGDNIKIKHCYNNVFNIVSSTEYNDMFSSGKWYVAYGYMSIPIVSNALARHCFIIDNDTNTVIDATILKTTGYKKDDESRFYIPLVIFDDVSEYLDAIQNNNYEPALYDYTIKLEKQLIDSWAKDNGYFLM